jgi:pilus assembly protein Flp/PilA
MVCLPASASCVADQRGASAVEYSLIVVAIAALIVSVLWALGGLVAEQYDHSCTAFEGQMQTGSGC